MRPDAGLSPVSMYWKVDGLHPLLLWCFFSSVGATLHHFPPFFSQVFTYIVHPVAKPFSRCWHCLARSLPHNTKQSNKRTSVFTPRSQFADCQGERHQPAGNCHWPKYVSWYWKCVKLHLRLRKLWFFQLNLVVCLNSRFSGFCLDFHSQLLHQPKENKLTAQAHRVLLFITA